MISVTEGTIQQTMSHLAVVVSHEQQVPAKVIEAVNYLHTTASETDKDCKGQSDAGLAAVFVGIAQGKAILKSANAAALRGQKDTGHLQDLTDCTAEISSFMETMPTSSSDEFKWAKAMDIGVRSINAQIDTQSKVNGASCKTVLTDAKKKIAEFVTTISKAFVLGPVQHWIIKWVAKYEDSKTCLAELPFAFDAWSTINVKYLGKDTTQALQCALASSKFLSEFASGIGTTLTSRGESGIAELF